MTSQFRSPPPDEPMLDVEEAQRRVLAEVLPSHVETVSIHDALGRVLGDDVAASYDLPQADNSAMDGYAVRATDIASAAAGRPVSLDVIEDLPAGSVSRRRLVAGSAIRIMTGAPLPEGADTIVPVELTDAGAETVSIESAVTLGSNIRRRAEDMRRGEVVLSRGMRLGSAEIGVLAAMQRSRIDVYRRPTVSILATGDEIVAIDAPLTQGKVVNSNSYALEALVRESGAEVRTMELAGDSCASTMEAIERGLRSDFIVSSGGVSVGAWDFVKEALDALGAETKFWRVAMKPGKPVLFARLKDALYFGLPGNPVSSMVAFLLFVAPALRKAMGQADDVLPPIIRARLTDSIHSGGGRRTYLRVRVTAAGEELEAHPMRAQGSGVSTSMVRANGLAIMEKEQRELKAGARVPVLLFGSIQSG